MQRIDDGSQKVWDILPLGLASIEEAGSDSFWLLASLEVSHYREAAYVDPA